MTRSERDCEQWRRVKRRVLCFHTLGPEVTLWISVYEGARDRSIGWYETEMAHFEREGPVVLNL